MLFRSNAAGTILANGMRTTFLLLSVFFLTGCGAFVNLELLGFSMYPDADNAILPTESAALSVCFDTPMDKLETQKALSVNHAVGTVKGDLEWQDDRLFFIPLEPWLPGLRYTLSVTGTIYALDGREEQVSRHVSFYAVTSESSPYVLDFSPADGSSVGVNPADGAFIRIVFSEAMDHQSTGAFSLDGVSGLEFCWSSDDTVLEVYAKSQLAPWTVYHWNLNAKARGKSGIPLGREISGQFVTDADRLLPAVIDVYPLIKASDPRWINTGAAMENGLGSSHAIGIEFNKPMDESVLRNIRFDPSISGQTELWKNTVAVFIPDRDPEPERTYTLIVSADSRDTGGLKMEKEFRFFFTADIPYLTVLSLNAGYGETAAEQNNTYSMQITAPDGLVTVALRFSHIMEIRAQADTVLALRLEPFFPGILKPLAFRSARWGSSDTVILQWEGATAGTAAEKHYYRLVLPGGKGGISDGKGSYLKEDLYFYFVGETK